MKMPNSTTGKNKLAIIVPYRDRLRHLNKFLPYMKVRYKDADIFIIEQTEGKGFNRGKLLNIGVLENPDYDYYALHDIDMLPVISDYSYPECPTLLATKVQQFGYKMPFDKYFGGVVLISKEDMFKCNGYHNGFFTWGAEDDSFRDRILAVGLNVAQRECTYNSLPHDRFIKPADHKKNIDLWKAGPQLEDGLSTCEYTVLSRKENHIIVEL